MIDALEYSKTRQRMCKTYNCHGCPLSGRRCSIGLFEDIREDEKIIEVIERWGKEHPAKTRQGELLKICPNVKFDSEGTVNICPKGIDSQYRIDCDTSNCRDCKMKYWSEEV